MSKGRMVEMQEVLVECLGKKEVGVVNSGK